MNNNRIDLSKNYEFLGRLEALLVNMKAACKLIKSMKMEHYPHISSIIITREFLQRQVEHLMALEKMFDEKIDREEDKGTVDWNDLINQKLLAGYDNLVDKTNDLKDKLDSLTDRVTSLEDGCYKTKEE